MGNGALSASCLCLCPLGLSNEEASCVAEQVCSRELLDWCDGLDSYGYGA